MQHFAAFNLQQFKHKLLANFTRQFILVLTRQLILVHFIKIKVCILYCDIVYV